MLVEKYANIVSLQWKVCCDLIAYRMINYSLDKEKREL